MFVGPFPNGRQRLIAQRVAQQRIDNFLTAGQLLVIVFQKYVTGGRNRASPVGGSESIERKNGQFLAPNPLESPARRQNLAPAPHRQPRHLDPRATL
jgi:hypothetical protein